MNFKHSDDQEKVLFLAIVDNAFVKIINHIYSNETAGNSHVKEIRILKTLLLKIDDSKCLHILDTLFQTYAEVNQSAIKLIKHLI